MTDIKDCLAQQIDIWGRVGHPAIMERFVLRNGKVFTPEPFSGRRLKRGECFSNASQSVNNGRFGGGIYVEGFGYRPGLTLIHHAWIGIGDDAIDPTWEAPESAEYMGVEFSDEERCHEQLRTGYYALLDNPTTMINVRLIFQRDPELKPIIEKFIGREINLEELT